jgi:hypothetical protein
MNIRFDYLYRDAGNYKSWGAVVFANPTGLSPDRIESLMRARFFDGEYFVAKDVNLPSLFSNIFDPDLDHSWHEFSNTEETEELPNDIEGRTIEKFVFDLGQSFGE